MGPYGSIWSHTLRIRSHIGYKGSGMAKLGLGYQILSKNSLDVGFKTFSKKTQKYEVTGARTRGPKSLVRPVPTFLTYSRALGGLILHFFLGPDF